MHSELKLAVKVHSYFSASPIWRLDFYGILKFLNSKLVHFIMKNNLQYSREH